MTKRRIHFTKLIHDILPTTAQANRYDKGNQTCPLCPCTAENRDHVLRCPSSAATKWRDSFQTNLRDFFRETQTAPVLTELTLSAFEKWFIADDELILDPLAYQTQVHKLIEEQNAIGWRQLFSGRFSCEWSTIQNASYSRVPPSDGQQKRTGLRWQTKFILKFWEEWDERWSDRNKAPHGHDAAIRFQAMRRETRQHLDNIYRDREFMQPHVQAFLQDSWKPTQRNWSAPLAIGSPHSKQCFGIVSAV